jgi:hypothetical protein
VSIFNKICPRCAGENPVTDSRCQCGYVFDASANTGSFDDLEIALQESEVYAEYLQVRMQQAKEIAEVAIAEQARSPEDASKSSIAAEADAEFRAAKAEYEEQMALVSQLRLQSRTAKDSETNKAQAAAWVKAEQQAKAKRLQQQAASERAKSTPGATHKAATTKTAKPAPTPARPIAASKPATGRTSPSPALRQKMAAAADSAAQRSRAQQARQKPVTAQPQKSPPASQAAKPVPRLAANEKECPNCTAVVPMNTRECKCGFGFAQGAEKMDGIGLSEEDRALLQMFRPAGGS